MRRVLTDAALYLYLAATLGFTLGTAALLGPIRWITAVLRHDALGREAELWVVRGVLMVLLVLTAGLALALLEGWREAPTAGRWRIILATGAAAAVAAVALWLPG